MLSRLVLIASASLLASVSALACDPADSPPTPVADRSGDTAALSPARKLDAVESQEQRFVAAAPTPPPAPPGTRAVQAKRWLYVQTCEPGFPCPTLVQGAGEAHCRELAGFARDGWRLPSRDEVEAFAGVEGLDRLAEYQWTRTPYEEDAAQVWIVDPVGGQPTTLPRDRKPLLVRCVNEA